MVGIAPHLFIISLYFLFFSFIVALVLTPLINKLTVRLGFLDKPGERKIHKKPVPMSGGIIIVISIVIVLSLNLTFVLLNYSYFSTENYFSHILNNIDLFAKWKEFFILGIAALILWTGGLVDDFYKLESLSRYKFLIQVVTACVIVFWGNVHITFFKPIIISQILSLIWIVGIINSFNLLDNMDGLSSGIAIICASVLLGIAVWQGEIIVATMSSIFVGALSAFIIFNFNPAKIFLGDNGSMTIGLIMSVLTLKVSYLKNVEGYFFPILIPVIILAIPLVDTFSVIIIRILNKKPIYVGDKNHISHRLLDLNFSVKEAVIIVYLLTMATSLSGFLIIKADIWFSLIILFQALVIVFLFLTLLIKGKSKEASVS